MSGLSSYRSTLERFDIFCHSRGVETQFAKSKDIAAYLKQFENHMLKTRQGYRTVLKAYFNWLIYEEVISKNPCNRITLEGNASAREKHELTREDINKIISKCRGLREKTMILFLWYSGMRASEMCNIRLANINLKTNRIFVNLSKSKSGNRPIPINNNLLPILKRYLELRGNLDHDFVFVNSLLNPIKVRTLQRIIHRLIHPMKFGPHTFRRGFVTQVYKATNDIELVRQLAGHSNISTTQNYILSVDLDKFKELSY